MPAQSSLEAFEGESPLALDNRNIDSTQGFELADLQHSAAVDATVPSQPRRILRLNTNMSYQPLSSKDPDEHKSYGSTGSSPAASPTALLIENVVLEDFERPQTSNPFLDPETADYWRKVYDGCEYECRHAFDPTLTWSKREEQELVRKLDWKVCLWAVCDPESSNICEETTTNS